VEKLGEILSGGGAKSVRATHASPQRPPQRSAKPRTQWWACWIVGKPYPAKIHAPNRKAAMEAAGKFGEVDQCEKLL